MCWPSLLTWPSGAPSPDDQQQDYVTLQAFGGLGHQSRFSTATGSSCGADVTQRENSLKGLTDD